MVETYRAQLIGIVLLFSHTIFKNAVSLPDILHDECDAPSCNFIYQRYYLIKRLRKTIVIFKKIADKPYKPTQLLQVATTFSSPPPLESTTIINLMDIVSETKQLTKLFTIWDDIVHYKYVHNTQLAQDFIKCILAISKNIVFSVSCQEKKEMLESLFTKTIHQESAEKLLNTVDIFIDEYVSYACSKKAAYSIQDIQCLLSRKTNEPDIQDYTTAVSQRLYHINRLTKPSEQLQQLNELHNIAIVHQKYQIVATLQRIPFKHQRIHACIEQMKKLNTFSPVIQVWKECQQFRYIADLLFVREYSELLYLILNQYTHLCKPTKKLRRLSIQSLALAYADVEGLPLEQILNATDMIIEEMPSIIEHYEFNTDMSWKEWLRKYWWAPPTVLLSLVIRVLLAQKVKEFVKETIAPKPKTQPQ